MHFIHFLVLAALYCKHILPTITVEFHYLFLSPSYLRMVLENMQTIEFWNLKESFGDGPSEF